MKCTKCGQEYTGNFCPKCGTAGQAQAQQPAGWNQSAAQPPAPPKKGGFKWWYILIGVVALALVVSVFGSSDEDKDGESSSAVESSVVSSEPESSEAEESSKRAEVNGYYVKFGTILDANPEGGVDGTTLVIKAKIDSQINNDTTINQNYYNVEDIVKNQNGTNFECIDYWAVADMADGSESKVMAFTIDVDTIKGLADGTILPNQLGDYADDLYIHPSLK